MSSSLPPPSSLVVKPSVKNRLVEIINLKYQEFLNMISELNSIAEYFLDDNGYHLIFSIVKGTDLTFFWKLTVRIECIKLKNGEADIKNYRILNIHQLLNIYDNIKQQSETLKSFQSQSNTTTSGAAVPPNDSSTSCAASCSKANLTESKLFDMIQSMNETPASDDDICCICMDEKNNVILTCSHNFCEKCIKVWKISSNTCPICRTKSNDNDCFILADRPDYYNVQDEMSKSLFEITDRKLSSTHKSSFSSSSAHHSSSSPNPLRHHADAALRNSENNFDNDSSDD